MAESLLEVTLCWSLAPRHVQEMNLSVPLGSTVKDVLDLAIAQALVSDADRQGADGGPHVSPPEWAHLAKWESLHFQQPGIWGRKVLWGQPVQAGDRVELYRPLKVDPKVARRQRFKRQGKGRTGLFANRKSGVAAGY